MKKLCFALSIAFSIATAAVLQGDTSSVPSGRRVTVTGCIEPASHQTPVGTAGTLGGAADTRFVLTTPWAGTANGGAPATPKNTVYRLADAGHAAVSAHEGQKVEITGTVGQTGSQRTERETGSTPVRSVPTMTVEAVKTLSSTCSR